jgi:23S rRNA (guanine745-N1)-methyltransferase
MTANSHVSIWACPVCHSALSHLPLREWRCENNHSFDVAKEGYINLLLAHQKNSSDPGDTKTMTASRRAFLTAGHYQPLAKKLAETLDQYLKRGATVLDSGCGDGYYLHQLLQHRSDLHLFGIDISRDATKLASRQLKEATFAVASSFDLPVLSASIDALLRVFAPGETKEVSRVLNPEGILVVASPGPRHLFALKALIYREVQEHTPPEPPKSFHLLDEQRISYQLELKGHESIKQLLSMTPFYWKGDRAAKAKLDTADSLNTEIDFVIRVYRPIKNDVWGSASIKQ